MNCPPLEGRRGRSYGGRASCGHAIPAGLAEHLPCLSGFFSQFFKADVLIEMRLSPFGIIAGTAIHQHDEPLGIDLAQCLGKGLKALYANVML